MSYDKNLAHLSFSDLEKKIKELTTLQKNNFALLMDAEETKHKCREARLLAQIEERAYSGIKKYLK